MEKIPLLIIVLLAVGIGLMATSFGVGVAGLLGENWIDYASTTTTSTTISGAPATIVAVIKANIGLFTTCYTVDTTTTITSIFGSSTTSLSTSDCVNSETTGYVDAGKFSIKRAEWLWSFFELNQSPLKRERSINFEAEIFGFCFTK